MFDFFGFDPKTLSDDELLNKATDLPAKIVWASRFGSADLIGNLQLYLQSIEVERIERLNRVLWGDRIAMTPDVIETDPDLAAEHKPEPVQDKHKIVPQQRPRPTITKTHRPTDGGETTK